MLRHIAIIMDGNGRWAAQRGLPRSDGHREGARAVRRIVTRARELGVEVLTLYAFSAQNWARPHGEVDRLMALLVEFCEGERNLLMEQDIRFQAIGQRDRLPHDTRDAVELLEQATADNRSMRLLVALSYGGREELVEAARQVARDVAAGRLMPEDVDEAQMAARLTTGGLPDPDVLVRTSGELRVSNFLLWQIAYAELVVSPKLWPDFEATDLDAAIAEFQGRKRRFGGLGEAPG